VLPHGLGSSGVIEVTVGEEKMGDRHLFRNGPEDSGEKLSGTAAATGVDQSRGVAEAYQVNRRVRRRGQPRAAYLPDILRNLHLSPIGALHLKPMHYIGLLHRHASELKEDETHDLKDYFEATKGTGVLATADSSGKVDAAVYSRPHFMEDGSIAFIMRDRLTHHNLQSNPHATFLSLKRGPATRASGCF